MGEMKRRMGVSDEAAHYYPSDVLSLDELAYWIAFSRVLGIGPVRFKALLDFFADDVAAAWHASRAALLEAGLDQKTSEKFLKQRAKMRPQDELERLKRLRVHVITWKDASYPPLLRKIEYPPMVLYVCGTLTEDDRNYALGIVGTRKMTSYGRQVTERFASELAQGQVTIVSGLALGIDTVAHAAALDAGGRTLAVLASGLDVVYPSSNYALAQRIVESGQGALVSAFPLGVRPEAGNFPARNHIISGLSLGVLVTEAPPRSGALITANSALNQGREVFAVPSGIFSPGGAGVDLALSCSAFTADPEQGGEPGLAEMLRVTKSGGKIVLIWPRPEDRAWLQAHGFAYVALPVEHEMGVHFRSLTSALHCANRFYARNSAIRRYILIKRRPDVPFSVIGVNPPCDYCWRSVP